MKKSGETVGRSNESKREVSQSSTFATVSHIMSQWVEGIRKVQSDIRSLMKVRKEEKLHPFTLHYRETGDRGMAANKFLNFYGTWKDVRRMRQTLKAMAEVPCVLSRTPAYRVANFGFLSFKWKDVREVDDFINGTLVPYGNAFRKMFEGGDVVFHNGVGQFMDRQTVAKMQSLFGWPLTEDVVTEATDAVLKKWGLLKTFQVMTTEQLVRQMCLTTIHFSFVPMNLLDADHRKIYVIREYETGLPMAKTTFPLPSPDELKPNTIVNIDYGEVCDDMPRFFKWFETVAMPRKCVVCLWAFVMSKKKMEEFNAQWEDHPLFDFHFSLVDGYVCNGSSSGDIEKAEATLRKKLVEMLA